MAVEFFDAPEVREIADELIKRDFPDLLGAVMGYLFKSKASKSQGKVTLGTCAKQGASQKALHGFDYVVTIAQDMWTQLTGEQKEALVYHELRHTFLDEDKKGDTQYKILPHDVEMFRDELKKYGPWRVDLELLVEQVEKGEVGEKKDNAQLSLF